VLKSTALDEETLHRGAVRAVMACGRKSGVWVNPLLDTDAFMMQATRNVSYSVLQLNRAVYDDDEPALPALVGRRPVLIAVDTTVDVLYGDRIRHYIDARVDVAGYVTLDSGEEHKSLTQVERVVDACIDAHFPRHGIIVGIGGGVALDIAGMAAALYRRGVSYIRVATTFLAMIDVAVGIKHAVNFRGKKNILGMFYPPMAAINDPLYLRTNSRRQLACGVAEAIKVALVADRRLFDLLEEHLPALFETHFQAPAPYAREILSRAQVAMMNELAPNLFETGLKRAVDFGHSFSPHIEAESDYMIHHGEAVAIDMLLSVAIGVRRGLCEPSLFERLHRIYGVAGLPMTDERCTVDFLSRALTDVTAHRGGDLNLLVPTAPGRYQFLQEVSDLDLQFALHAVSTKAVAEAG
jgi:2-epi-5-epi-valiolone synthase